MRTDRDFSFSYDNLLVGKRQEATGSPHQELEGKSSLNLTKASSTTARSRLKFPFFLSIQENVNILESKMMMMMEIC